MTFTLSSVWQDFINRIAQDTIFVIFYGILLGIVLGATLFLSKLSDLFVDPRLKQDPEE
jgi:tetrahydromethanopterin S-methyltransferase subunit G